MRTLIFLCCAIISTNGVRGSDGVQPKGAPDPRHTVVLTGDNGTFYSPFYPNLYPNNANYVWRISVNGPPDRTVYLKLTNVDIEENEDCSYDALYVYDGPTFSDHLLRKVCGTNNTFLLSTSSQITVRFITDGIIQHRGFRAEYQMIRTVERHFLLTDSSGTFYSPNYPYPYPELILYVWQISPNASAGQIVELKLSDVDIEPQPLCLFDNAYGFDGVFNYSSRPLGMVCGTNNATFYSTGRHLSLVFQTDHTVQHRGFRADYKIVTRGSCRYNCGYQVGSCSCSSSCQRRGNCCPDYEDYCLSTQAPATASPLCENNCGRKLGSCSCSFTCQYDGTCCYDYKYFCPTSTDAPQTSSWYSCHSNCGYHMGTCSCRSSCQYDGNCCSDYSVYCYTTTPSTDFTDQPSCQYNCGSYLGSCSCSSDCQYFGGCCHDYSVYCSTTSEAPHITDQPSCRYNCGSYVGSCSCRSSCQYYGNCCHDYSYYCPSTTEAAATTPSWRSCRYNCGYDMGSCSCRSSCQYNGNCCHDYSYYCPSPTGAAATTPYWRSCRYNCGSHLGSCSCRSSCEYYGNCCYDYYSYCSYTTKVPATETPCGGHLFGSGTISSPNHPNHYPDNAYCQWRLKALDSQTIFLAFDFLQLENCCSCDYISVYDGPSTSYQHLGKACNSSAPYFYSSSNYMTVVFRSDSSVVGRGFKAKFTSSLPPSSGRVSCSSYNMTIVIQRSYLISIGYDGNDLYLNEQHCKPIITSFEVIFRYNLDGCGNIRTVENGRVVYSNNVHAYTSSSGEITRQPYFKLKVGCRMEQNSVSQIMYLVENSGNSSIEGTGGFNSSMAFYTSSSFYYEVTESPYEVLLNQELYVQVKLEGSVHGLVAFLDTCLASPYSHFQNRKYYLVRDGCRQDNTVRIYSSGSTSHARFSFKAFQFLRASESVYLQCKILICNSYDTSACRGGCHRRRARSLGSKQPHDSHTVILGPIRLKDQSQKEEETQGEKKL